MVECGRRKLGGVWICVNRMDSRWFVWNKQCVESMNEGFIASTFPFTLDSIFSSKQTLLQINSVILSLK